MLTLSCLRPCFIQKDLTQTQIWNTRSLMKLPRSCTAVTQPKDCHSCHRQPGCVPDACMCRPARHDHVAPVAPPGTPPPRPQTQRLMHLLIDSAVDAVKNAWDAAEQGWAQCHNVVQHLGDVALQSSTSISVFSSLSGVEAVMQDP